MTRVPTAEFDLGEFERLPLLSESMPLDFGNGLRWSSFTGTCIGCGRPVREDRMRGVVSEHREDGYRTARVLYYRVTALGFCEPCDMCTPYKYAVLRDGRTVGIEGTRVTVYGYERAAPWWRRAWSWLTGRKA